MSATTIHPDERAAEMIRQHHTSLVEQLTERVDAVRHADDATFGAARGALVDWLRSELVPHAIGEETTVYSAAAELDRGRLLIEALVSEHSVIRDFVQQIEFCDNRDEVAGWASALLRTFVSHAALENNLVLPLLVQDTGTDLHALLHEMHGH